MIVTTEVLGPHPAGGTTRTVLATPGQKVPDDVWETWLEDPAIDTGSEPVVEIDQADAQAVANAAFAGGIAAMREQLAAENAEIPEGDTSAPAAAPDAEATEPLDLEALKARAVELGINPGNSKAETLAAKIAEAEAAAGDAGD